MRPLQFNSSEKILRPLLFVSRVLGAYPCDDNSKRSLLWISWSALITVLFAGNCVQEVVYTFGSIENNKYSLASQGLVCLQITSSLILCIKAAPTLARVVHTLARIESKLVHWNTAPVYDVSLLVLDISLRTGALLFVGSLRLAYTYHVIPRLLELLNVFVLTWIELVNVALLSCFRQCLEHVNRNINKRNVHFFLQLQQVLLTSAKDYREVTEKRLLFRVGTTYMITTIELYFLLSILGDEAASKNRKIYHFITAPYNLYEIILTVYSIHFFSKEVERLRIKLFGMVLSDKSNQLSKDAKVLAQLRMKEEVKFSAGGLFPLDPTLIHTILASAANYLTILYQFGGRQTLASEDS